jgi:hypothetical protein
MDGVSLLLTLDTFKKRLSNDCLEVQREEGYLKKEKFYFNAPASPNDLKKLPQNTPQEIIDFLKEHNGANLFVDPEYGGSIQFFSVDEILEYREVWECPENFIPFAAGRDGESIICEITQFNENRVWVGEAISFDDEFERLPMDFNSWLDYLFIAQGAHFWDWFR